MGKNVFKRMSRSEETRSLLSESLKNSKRRMKTNFRPAVLEILYSTFSSKYSIEQKTKFNEIYDDVITITQTFLKLILVILPAVVNAMLNLSKYINKIL